MSAQDDVLRSIRSGGAADAAAAPRWPSASESTREAVARRRDALARAGFATTQLAGEGPEIAPEGLARSVEGFVGFARVPVGVFGPLLLRGEEARGELHVPLATSEGALVMSFQHVANLVARTEGIAARCTDQAVWRAPGFVFESLAQAAQAAAWIEGRRPELEELAAAGSRHCRLARLETLVAGREVYLRLGFTTGDAAGQNMVTQASERICERLLAGLPHAPARWQIEANLSGDKKASALALAGVRGRRASAEVLVPDRLLRRYFRCGARDMAAAWDLAASGAVQSGTIGSQGNHANALAGLFIACGQDVACVAEAAAGLNRVQCDASGDLYVSVTLPNLVVGTVGGGTYLPTAAECLDLLGCRGEGKARRFAEVCAAVVLVGELALIGAMAGGSYARAHAAVGRREAPGGA